MALNLTSEEMGKVARSSFRDDLTYYNAGTGTQVAVSDDFKAFLTLAPPSTKADAVSWIRSMMIPNVDPVRQALYTEAALAETLEVNLQRAQLTPVLLLYNNFQQNFPGDPRFSAIDEVGMIIADAGLSMGRISEHGRHLKNRSVLASSIRTRYVGLNPGVDGQRKRQALSWILPLSVPTGL